MSGSGMPWACALRTHSVAAWDSRAICIPTRPSGTTKISATARVNTVGSRTLCFPVPNCRCARQYNGQSATAKMPAQTSALRKPSSV